eukprot:4870669-Pleurochrysis_carterae.AAC.1
MNCSRQSRRGRSPHRGRDLHHGSVGLPATLAAVTRLAAARGGGAAAAWACIPLAITSILHAEAE